MMDVRSTHQTYCVLVATLGFAFLTSSTAAQLFEINELQQLTAPDVEEGDDFGFSLSFDGTRAILGAPRDDDAGINAGAAYVFVRDDNGTAQDPSDDVWSLEAKLIGSDTTNPDQFGSSVGIDGDRVVVSAPQDSHSNETTAGSAYVFRREGGTWVEEAKLIADDPANVQDYGSSVAIQGDRIVVGVKRDDADGCVSNLNCDSGSAYVYRREGTSWIVEDRLIASDWTRGDYFGSSVAISGDRILVGAERDDDVAFCAGSAYVFRRDDNGTPTNPSDDFWIEEAKIVASDPSNTAIFGQSVAIDGDLAVVGSPHGHGTVPQGGAAYVFRRDDGGTPLDPNDDLWLQVSKLTGADAFETFTVGHSVSARVDHIVVAPGYLFRRCDGVSPRVGQAVVGEELWVQQAKLTPSDLDPAFPFVSFSAVAMADNIVVRGRSGQNGSGFDSGKAYVFEVSDSDCNGNAVPDACEPDCNLNGIADSCDITDGASFDCMGDGVPDECQADCNVNGLEDSCDIADGTSEDCTGDGVPDECDTDCNENGIPDSCDIGSGTSVDVDGDGLPDECCFPSSVPQSDPVDLDVGFGTKNRYVSFAAGNAGRSQAIRITFTDLPADFDFADGWTMWVGEPRFVTEAAGSNANSPEPLFATAKLECEPFWADFSQFGVLHVYGAGVVPLGRYDIQVVDFSASCPLSNELSFSTGLSIWTSSVGDVVGFGFDQVIPGHWNPPEGVTSHVDISALVDKFLNNGLAPLKAKADVINSDVSRPIPDQIVDFVDISYVVDAFRHVEAPPPGPVPCS